MNDRPRLALDTSTAVSSIALGRSDALLAEVTLGLTGRPSTALMPAVDSVVRWAGLTPAQLGGVVIAGGPGSFTGLRIGAATAKGIVYALGLPMWSYSGLLGAAVSCAVAAGRDEALVCALFDARRRDVYAACYRIGATAPVTASDAGSPVHTVLAPTALSLDALIERFRGEAVPLFTGEAAQLHRRELEAELGATVVPPHLDVPRASALLWLAERLPAQGRVAEPGSWEPEYLRASGAERIAAARQGGA